MTDYPQARKILEWLNPLELSELRTLQCLKEVLPKFSSSTLLTRDFFEALLCSARHFNLPAEGDWAQVGVWKGGGALFLRALMEDMALHGRTLHLFDSFTNLHAEQLSMPEDKAFVEVIGHDMPMNYEQEARSLLERFGFSSGFRMLRCNVNDCDTGIAPPRLSLLHIDVDFFEPTRSALSIFYNNVLPGGVVIIDDYFLDLVNCRQAVDAFIQEHDLDGEVSLERFSSFSLLIRKKI